MPPWPFRRKPAQPPNQDAAFADLAQMFIVYPPDPTPGADLLDAAAMDFTLESLRAVDRHLDRMRKHDLKDAALFKFILRCGAYVGEVTRRNAPTPDTWHWLDYEVAVVLDPTLAQLGKGLGTVAILWRGADAFCFPLGKVGKYLQNGPEDSVYMFARVLTSDPPV